MNIFRKFCFLSILLFSSASIAQSLVPPEGQTTSYFQIEELQWNRYTSSRNFVILSIDDGRGKWLSENLDRLRQSIFSKWGFENFSSNVEIRVFCVPDKESLKKLFAIEKPRIEKRDNLIAVWAILGSDLASEFAPVLEEAVLTEFEIYSKNELPFWFKKGALVLSNDVLTINQELKNLKKTLDNNQLFSMDRVFKMDVEAYDKESLEKRELYDQQSAALCLMLRKEFGGFKMRKFLASCSEQGVEKSLNSVYGFNGVGHFGKQYLHYLRDLCSQAAEDKILASYLEIKPL